MHEHLPNTTTDLVLADLSAAKRALLQQYLGGGLAFPSPESCVIARRPPEEPPPPSFGQEQLWIHSQLVTDHRLYLTLHQIIFDGVSLYSVFLPELANLYEAFVHGRPPTLPNPPIQYADFAHWQRTQSETVSDELAYWREQLAGAPAALD